MAAQLQQAAVGGARPSSEALRRLLEASVRVLRHSAAQSAVLRWLLVGAAAAGPAVLLLAARLLQRRLGLAWPASAEEARVCAVCKLPLTQVSRMSGPACRLPHGRGLSGQLAGKYCHLGCLVCGREAADSPLPLALAEELWTLSTDSPEVWKQRDHEVRICNEDRRLNRADELCQSSPAPSTMAWAFEGAKVVRITSCALTLVAREVGRMKQLHSLVLISCDLVVLPAELGELTGLKYLLLKGNHLKTLPKGVGQLPLLEEVCVDGNQITVLPRFRCPCLRALTAPGNLLWKAPEFQVSPETLELHGNFLSELPGGDKWGRLRSLTAMGNQLQAFPAGMATGLQWIENLNLADNRLLSLPANIASLRYLESLSLYNNRLSVLPHNLLLGTRMKRLLIEGNPLQGDALADLAENVENPKAQVQTLGIDENQARTLAEFASEAVVDRLPACWTVGSLVQVEGSSHSDGMYLKLCRASQLRRAPGVRLAGSSSGPPSCRASPAEVLVVAFAASQGEPEWLGLLRALPGKRGALEAYPPAIGPLAAYLGEAATVNDDRRLIALWRPAGEDGTSSDVESWEVADAEGCPPPLPDFDVLIACDARMRWYSEDAECVERALARACAPYKRRLFIGASMGGHASLRHGANLADAVLAFGPQVLLHQATLRPPAPHRAALEAHYDAVRASVLTARARGAVVEVHCAADTHMEHAYGLPLDDLALVVHPLLPRVPFARLLERANVLWPIVGAALERLLAASGAAPAAQQTASPADAAEPRVCVARWGDGKLFRYHAGREEVRAFFFGRRAPSTLPRPGDWYCAICSCRNMKHSFFCSRCTRGASDFEGAPAICDDGVTKVAAQGYPRRGDWGCGGCGSAMQARDNECWHCKKSWNDPQNVEV